MRPLWGNISADYIDADDTMSNQIDQSAEQGKTRWLEAFDTALHSMLDYEMRPEQVRKQVALCAEIADAALDEIEKRWK